MTHHKTGQLAERRSTVNMKVAKNVKKYRKMNARLKQMTSFSFILGWMMNLLVFIDIPLWWMVYVNIHAIIKFKVIRPSSLIQDGLIWGLGTQDAIQ